MDRDAKGIVAFAALEVDGNSSRKRHVAYHHPTTTTFVFFFFVVVVIACVRVSSSSRALTSEDIIPIGASVSFP